MPPKILYVKTDHVHDFRHLQQHDFPETPGVQWLRYISVRRQRDLQNLLSPLIATNSGGRTTKFAQEMGFQLTCILLFTKFKVYFNSLFLSVLIIIWNFVCWKFHIHV